MRVVYSLLIESSIDLKLGSGILVAVPIPEEHAADREQIDGAIEQAVLQAKYVTVYTYIHHSHT